MHRLKYFDNASTTPLRKEVFEAMRPYFREKYGNPSNIYGLGREARLGIIRATETITHIIGCKPSEFVYTGSATESDNLALAGIARTNKEFGNRIIISALEHKGIMAVCQALKKEGFEIIELPVAKNGLVDLVELKQALNDRTILVSITMADSETGTIQPIKNIAEIIKRFRRQNTPVSTDSKEQPKSNRAPRFKTEISDNTSLPYFHSDGSQAVGYSDVNVKRLGLDLLTLSAHKFGGPKGIGGLYVGEGVKIQPIIYGGGQNRLRSGTENVPAIVGFGAALELNNRNRNTERRRLKTLRDKLEKGLMRNLPKIVLNGHKTKRLPNFLNISILDVEGEALLLHLDECGIIANTGSACNSESLEPSYVLTSMGSCYEFVHGSIRFTLGHDTTSKDIAFVIRHLPDIVRKLRAISPLNLELNHAKKIAEPRAFIGGKTPHFLRKSKNPPSFGLRLRTPPFPKGDPPTNR